MGILAVALAFIGQAASPEGKSKFGIKDSFHGAIACFRRIRQGCTNEWNPSLLLAFIIWVFLVGAASRPQWVGEAIELPVSGRSVMLAVDLSGSMEETDLELGGQPVTRLQVVKSVLKPFIERREGDRLGLILFGDQAYLQTPLTFDRKTLSQMLEEAELGLAGEKTAIGDAIGLAVKRMLELSEEEKVLVLLTDGRNTCLLYTSPSPRD